MTKSCARNNNTAKEKYHTVYVIQCENIIGSSFKNDKAKKKIKKLFKQPRSGQKYLN